MEFQSDFVKNWWEDHHRDESVNMIQCDAGRFSVNRCTNENEFVLMLGKKAFNLCGDHHQFAMSVINDCQIEDYHEC